MSKIKQMTFKVIFSQKGFHALIDIRVLETV